MNPPPASPVHSPVRLSRVLLVLTILVLIGLAIGLIPRLRAQHNLVDETHASSVLSVDVISAVPEKHDLGTPVPAEVQAFVSASIHARASGYLRNWLVDIGDIVTNGQVLAEIDTPELDEQLAQAKAELDQANASLALAKITADRWTELLKTSSVSAQEEAEKSADYTLKQADVEAAKANVDRLSKLKEFDRVTAPFNGTITRRNTDIGQLIAAGSGPELFDLAQTDPLRIYVRVPQSLAHALAPGQTASLLFDDAPGKSYTARVTRTAGAVDPGSRTLEVELQVANPHNEILAGSFAEVRFDQAANVQILTLTDNALLFRAQGMQIAVVDRDNKVSLRSVKLGRDFGNTVEILSGLSAGDKVINNPPDSIAEGMDVSINQPASPTNVAAK